MESIITHTIDETFALASDFVQRAIKNKKIICLKGDLGGGKTTFAQGILGACGAQKPYTSPTFVIMKEYNVQKTDIKKIYHIDAYRIGENDMLSLGWDELISDERALVIVEWPENIESILPKDAHMILCELVSETSRRYTFCSANELVSECKK